MPVGLEVAKVHLEHGPVWSPPVFAQGEDEQCRPAVAAASNGDLVVACSRRGAINIDLFAGADAGWMPPFVLAIVQAKAAGRAVEQAPDHGLE
jgi:hypothetical protein